MAIILNEKLMVELLELVSKDSMSVHQLCCKTCRDHRTIKKYVQLIMHIQKSPKVKLEMVGMRVRVGVEK
ncbi:MAG: hypothetical protein NTX79_04545 [Candidatus Micrarchaeota archaeon]|nr:hypothetical protein [Candidatus Micrarchaeota archaeon]